VSKHHYKGNTELLLSTKNRANSMQRQQWPWGERGAFSNLFFHCLTSCSKDILEGKHWTYLLY